VGETVPLFDVLPLQAEDLNSIVVLIRNEDTITRIHNYAMGSNKFTWAAPGAAPRFFVDAFRRKDVNGGVPIAVAHIVITIGSLCDVCRMIEGRLPMGHVPITETKHLFAAGVKSDHAVAIPIDDQNVAIMVHGDTVGIANYANSKGSDKRSILVESHDWRVRTLTNINFAVCGHRHPADVPELKGARQLVP